MRNISDKIESRARERKTLKRSTEAKIAVSLAYLSLQHFLQR